jgi:hypothetical protein
MSLMDIPETERVLAEVFRVLKPEGFFQFSIAHPCFDTLHRRNLRDESGYTYAIEVGDYFVGREGGRGQGVALLRRSTGDARGAIPFPDSRFHADLELVAEQDGRSRVRSGTLRRTVSE